MTGWRDMPPYVTKVPPGAKVLANVTQDLPPTALKPSNGFGNSASIDRPSGLRAYMAVTMAKELNFAS